SSVNASPGPTLHSWMEAIAEVTRLGGPWLSQGPVLEWGISSQSTHTVPVNGLGATESRTAVTSFPLLNWVSVDASGGFHDPASTSNSAAQGFAGLGSPGRVFGAGFRAKLTEDVNATVHFERLTAYSGAPHGAIDSKIVALRIGFRF